VLFKRSVQLVNQRITSVFGGVKAGWAVEIPVRRIIIIRGHQLHIPLERYRERARGQGRSSLQTISKKYVLGTSIRAVR